MTIPVTGSAQQAEIWTPEGLKNALESVADETRTFRIRRSDDNRSFVCVSSMGERFFVSRSVDQDYEIVILQTNHRIADLVLDIDAILGRRINFSYNYVDNDRLIYMQEWTTDYSRRLEELKENGYKRYFKAYGAN